jgi:hypothetical protein
MEQIAKQQEMKFLSKRLLEKRRKWGMSKRSRSLAKRDAKERAKGGKVVSFFGGLIFVSTVVGFTIVKNRSLYEEISKQVSNALSVTKNILSQAQMVADRISGIGKLMKADISEFSNNSENMKSTMSDERQDSSTRTEVRINNLSEAEKARNSVALKSRLEEYERFWKQDV